MRMAKPSIWAQRLVRDGSCPTLSMDGCGNASHRDKAHSSQAHPRLSLLRRGYAPSIPFISRQSVRDSGFCTSSVHDFQNDAQHDLRAWERVRRLRANSRMHVKTY